RARRSPRASTPLRRGACCRDHPALATRVRFLAGGGLHGHGHHGQGTVLPGEATERNPVHSVAGKGRCPASGCLESRMAAPLGSSATSTQFTRSLLELDLKNPRSLEVLMLIALLQGLLDELNGV